MGENGVKAVLTTAGVGSDEARITVLVVALGGVNIEEAIKAAAAAPAKEDEESGMAGRRHSVRLKSFVLFLIRRLFNRSVFIEIYLDPGCEVATGRLSTMEFSGPT